MKSPQYSVTQVNDVYMVRSMKSKLAVTKASEKAGADSAIKMLNALGFGGSAAQERQADGSLLVWLESYL